MGAGGRAHVVAGLFGIVAGLLVTIGAALPAVTVHASELALGVPAPSFPATFAARIAGIVCAALGLAVTVLGARVRPALSVAWSGLPLTVVAVLVPALAATAAPSGLDALVTLGAALPRFTLSLGAWLLISGAVLGVAAGIACLVAGNADRDAAPAMPGDDGGGPPAALRAAAAVAGVVAVVGLLLPAYSSPLGSAPWIGRDALPAVETWTQSGVAVALAVVAVLVPRSRPARAVALALGAALVATDYALLARGPAGATAASGSYCSVAGAVLFVLVAVVVPMVGRRPAQ
ncbi:hypothetical protein GCM10023147_25160 [Tsukamurella soli]|uniref:Uncharacterized protein n=2 Tax=Tsukamurella soli TaxID=644556 RepID=A0ABP8JP66_9ACTN